MVSRKLKRKLIPHVFFVLLLLVTLPAFVLYTNYRSRTRNIPPSQASSCTLFASPNVANGSGNTGTNPTSAVSLLDAKNKTVPGSVVCLLNGTYMMSKALTITATSHSGSVNDWIVYQPYEVPGNVTLKAATNFDQTQAKFFHIRQGGHHIEIRGLRFDGSDIIDSALFCQGEDTPEGWGHHIRVVNNVIKNMGAAGVNSKYCDYMTVVENKIYRVGKTTGWGSGISLNTSRWLDQAAGFHSFVAGNIISGVWDCCGESRDPSNPGKITDGNGIIMDRGGKIPPVLIANNVIYQNGGRCIHLFHTENTWVVNNTCYKNALDLDVGSDGSTEPRVGEYTLNDTINNYHINNLVVAWSPRFSFQQTDGTKALSVYRKNIWSGGNKPYNVPDSNLTDQNQFRNVDPQYLNPPAVDSTSTVDNQFLNAIDPEQIGDRLTLKSTSPGINTGIDPRTITSDTVIKDGLGQYILKDTNGNPRPSGSGWDLGAYEYIAPTATPIPTATQAPVATNNTTSSTSTTNTATKYPNADTYVNVQEPAKNYGQSKLLYIDTSPHRLAFFKFDLSQFGGKIITSAKLRLRIENGSNGDQFVREVPSLEWSESSLTYNNKANGITPNIADFPATNSGSYVELDLTSFIQTHSGKIVAMLVGSQSENELAIYSREADTISYRPQLIVSYK